MPERARACWYHSILHVYNDHHDNCEGWKRVDAKLQEAVCWLGAYSVCGKSGNIMGSLNTMFDVCEWCYKVNFFLPLWSCLVIITFVNHLYFLVLFNNFIPIKMCHIYFQLPLSMPWVTCNMFPTHFVSAPLKIFLLGLERWLRVQDHCMIFQRFRVWVPTTT